MESVAYTEIRNKFLQLNRLNSNEIIQAVKENEIRKVCFDKENPYYYIDQIYNGSTIEDIGKIKIELEFCETPKQHDMFNFIRVYTSSIQTKKNKGRLVRIMVKDVNTNKYIGIIAIGSDLYSYDARDQYLEWSKLDSIDKKKMINTKLDHVMNVWCCVPAQPFGYNFNGGKLMASLCFSKEVHDYVYTKYNIKLAGLSTFSINGKSVLYDRLECLKLIGYTKGKGLQVPEDLYQEALQVINLPGNILCQSSMFKIMYIVKQFDVPLSVIEHDIKRGVYFGTFSDSALKFLKSKNIEEFDCSGLLDSSSIFGKWKERWATQRYKNLKEHQRIIEELKQPMVVSYNKTLLNKYLRPLNKSYIAGMIDGDGSIGFIEQKYEVTLYVSINQCDPRPLFALQHMYGGKIELKKLRKENTRDQFRFSITNTYCLNILQDILPFMILKRTRVQLALQYIEQLKNKSDSKETIELLSKLNKEKIFDTTYFEHISYEYISGLFDAEGSISATKKATGYISPAVTLTQKCSHGILEKMCVFTDLMRLSGPRVCIYNYEDCATFLQKILPYLIVKREQADWFLTDYKHHFKKITGFKHINFHIPKELLQETQVEAYTQTYEANIQSREIKKTASTYKKEQFSKRQSIRMTGENNPNVGREKTPKWFTSQATGHNTTRKITDDQIQKVRDLLNTGLTKKDIQEQVNVSRDHVYKISKGEMVKTTEKGLNVFIETKNANAEDNAIKNELKAQGMSTEKVHALRTSIGKRKVSKEKRIEILKFMCKNPHIMPIVASEYSEHLFEQIISNDIINSVCGGKRGRLAESEFPIDDISYADYENLLDVYKSKEPERKKMKVKQVFKLEELLQSINV
jgi:hypothetical protein